MGWGGGDAEPLITWLTFTKTVPVLILSNCSGCSQPSAIDHERLGIQIAYLTAFTASAPYFVDQLDMLTVHIKTIYSHKQVFNFHLCLLGF